MSVEYVGLIERFLASELGVDFEGSSLDACNQLSEEQVDFFNSQLSAVDSDLHDKMVQVEPQRVLAISEGATKQSWITDDDIRPMSAMFTHPYNRLTPISISHLKRQLLFFSRVAIIVPELPYAHGAMTKRENLVTFLKTFLTLKPLIQNRSVVLLPRRGFYSNEIEGGAALVRIACEGDPAIPTWISSHRQLLDDFAKGARRGDPFFDAGIRICSALAYGHTLAATHPFVGHLHKMLLSDRPRVDRAQIMAIQNIDKIDLPGLGGLTWNDVVAVRRDEDSLERWRADLAAAISNVDPNLPSEEFVERFDSQVQAQLRRSALELGEKLNESAPMARFRKGATELAISAIAATAKVALGGPLAIWDAIRDVARNEGAKEALKFMWESREAAAKKALRGHYAVFSSNK